MLKVEEGIRELGLCGGVGDVYYCMNKKARYQMLSSLESSKLYLKERIMAMNLAIIMTINMAIIVAKIKAMIMATIMAMIMAMIKVTIIVLFTLLGMTLIFDYLMSFIPFII